MNLTTTLAGCLIVLIVVIFIALIIYGATRKPIDVEISSALRTLQDVRKRFTRHDNIVELIDQAVDETFAANQRRGADPVKQIFIDELRAIISLVALEREVAQYPVTVIEERYGDIRSEVSVALRRYKRRVENLKIDIPVDTTQRSDAIVKIMCSKVPVTSLDQVLDVKTLADATSTPTTAESLKESSNLFHWKIDQSLLTLRAMRDSVKKLNRPAQQRAELAFQLSAACNYTEEYFDGQVPHSDIELFQGHLAMLVKLMRYYLGRASRFPSGYLEAGDADVDEGAQGDGNAAPDPMAAWHDRTIAAIDGYTDYARRACLRRDYPNEQDFQERADSLAALKDIQIDFTWPSEKPEPVE